MIVSRSDAGFGKQSFQSVRSQAGAWERVVVLGYISKNSRDGSSITSLIVFKNDTASRPSTMR